ncbi:MAG: putative Ser/Thr protein kinase [Planctomycetota bacterium]|jgi:predicted Ser/Thr protein kinase
MTGDHDEVIGKLSEELTDAMAAGEIITLAEWAERFHVHEDDVRQCQRGLEALDLSFGEEMVDGHPELPQPQLPSDFEVVNELGRGGMGVVYRARQRSLDRDVAIKVLRPGDLVFGDALRRFRAEARSLARLRHRHIVSVYDSGETPEGLVWFAMDLVDGRTLAEELKARGRMLPARAAKIIRQITSAIAHAHAQGIVHRDLKPQNVLIDGDGDAFVVDFGLARDAASAGTNTMSGELLGTPAYMSPEQARGDASQIGEASDVWALGALLYEMLAGRGAFAGKPLHETIRAILHDEPPALRRGDKRVPQDLDRICLHALQKRPEDRYPGALAFGEDVERFQDGRGVTAQTPSKVARIARDLQRRWRPIAAIAAAVLVTVVTVASWLPSIRRDAVVSEAQRLVATGHPEAAIASFRSLLADLPRNSSGYEELQYDLVRALNDRAGDRLAAQDETEAMALTSEALAIAQRRTHQDGSIMPSAWAMEEQWRWEFLRASVFGSGEDLPALDITARLRSDLQSGLPGRVALARRAASMGWVEVCSLADSLRLPVLADAVRAQARRLQTKNTTEISFPFTWSGTNVDAWWSTSVEDMLADLAVDTEESMPTRAVAFRAWSQLVGLPTFERLQDSLPDNAAFPTAAAVANAAPAVIAEWRTWRVQPRADACKARIDLLVMAMQRPNEVLPGAQQLVTQAQRWTGYSGNNDEPSFIAWWQQVRDRPYAELLREALKLTAEQTTPLTAALDRSASIEHATARLWRQLAWLQLPDGARIPECIPKLATNGHVWRTACIAASQQADARPLTAHAVLLRFDDGRHQPEVVAQSQQLVHIGSEVSLHLDATVAQPSWLSLRSIWADEFLRQSQPIPPNTPGSATRPPRIGEVSASLHGRVHMDHSGVWLDDISTSHFGQSLPWHKFSVAHTGLKRVWLDHAGSARGTTVVWDMARRTTTFVLLVGLEEGANDHDADLDWWRTAVARTFVSAAAQSEEAQSLEAQSLQAQSRDAQPGKRRYSADWLTASLWPMPAALAAMQSLRNDQKQTANPSIRIANMLAGGPVNSLSTWATIGREHPIAVALRLAAGSPNAKVRASALTMLSGMPDWYWLPRFANTLRQAALALGTEVPAKLIERIKSQPSPDGLMDWLSRNQAMNTLLGLAICIWFFGWKLYRGTERRRAIAAWCAIAAILLLYVRITIAGVILTPSFVAITLLLACVWRASGRRSKWRIAGLCLLGLFALWAASSWYLDVSPPHNLEGLLTLAALVAAWPERTRHGRAAKTLPSTKLDLDATAATVRLGRRTHRQKSNKARRSRSKRTVLLTVIASVAIGYGVVKAISYQMSQSLFANATLHIVDTSGKPVSGVPVWVAWTEPWPSAKHTALPASDATGRVDLSSLQSELAMFARFHLEVELAGHAAEVCLLTSNTTIQVPEVGSLVVQLRDADNQPWQDPSAQHMRAWLRNGRGKTFDANGRTVFPVVACNQLQLSIQAQGFGTTMPLLVDGPASTGETRIYDFVIPRDTARLTGVVHSHDGTPQQGDLGLDLKGTGGSMMGWTVTADAEGRFQFLLSSNPSGGTLTIHRGWGRPLKIDIPAGPGPTFDLGTVTFRAQ